MEDSHRKAHGRTLTDALREMKARATDFEFVELVDMGIRASLFALSGLVLYILILSYGKDGAILLKTNEYGTLKPLMVVFAVLALVGLWRVIASMSEREMSHREGKRQTITPIIETGIESSDDEPEPITETFDDDITQSRGYGILFVYAGIVAIGIVIFLILTMV